MLRRLLLVVFINPFISAYLQHGPEITATKGEVWPKPLWQDDSSLYFQIDPKNFKFVVVYQNCYLLQRAISRYTKIIEDSIKSPILADGIPLLKTLSQIEVNLTNPCEELPYHGMDESYFVYGHGKVVANSIWGILRGMESLSQLLVPMSNGMLRIPETEIYDEPRFVYRGFMLDTARHFISMPKITQLIDAMAYNKFNVFHWHMTDDSAFPYGSTTFPELAIKGAYSDRMTYSDVDVGQIIEYARERGIRVIPEFDTPAHTASWGASHPEIMTKCYGVNNGQLGPLNPTQKKTYDFLDTFFSEVKQVFPDKFIHLGGDEVDSACWESNPEIQIYLKNQGQDSGDLSYMYLEQHATNICRLGRMPIVWQEVIEENPGIELPRGTIAQVWYDYRTAMGSLTKKGYSTIMSDGFYVSTGDDESDWTKFYLVEPTDFTGSMAQKKRVIGGEACLWTEWVNDNNVMTVAFPRASAVAERLWSAKAHRNITEAEPRLEEHNCRMKSRGIETKPANGYGLC